MSTSSWGLASDAELIAAVRSGQSAAFGVLYERHGEAARVVARQYSNTAVDADDAVADAFQRVLAIIQGGGGPDAAFRAYLFTVVRRVAMQRIESGRHVQATDDLGTLEDALDLEESTEEPALVGFEHGVVSRAYTSLPERWQAILWYTEVEDLTPAEVAPILGLTANGVAALAYRAREGLRQAYLQQHLVSPASEACTIVNSRLGAYVRAGLAKRETALVESHLGECGDCRALVLELGDVNHGMRAVVAPLVLGGIALAVLHGIGFGGAAGAEAAAAGTAAGVGGGLGAGAAPGAPAAPIASLVSTASASQPAATATMVGTTGTSGAAAGGAVAGTVGSPAMGVIGTAAVGLVVAGVVGVAGVMGLFSSDKDTTRNTAPYEQSALTSAEPTEEPTEEETARPDERETARPDERETAGPDEQGTAGRTEEGTAGSGEGTAGGSTPADGAPTADPGSSDPPPETVRPPAGAAPALALAVPTEIALGKGGTIVDYALTLSGTGDGAATDVAIDIDLPANVFYDGYVPGAGWVCPASVSGANETVSCTLGSATAGASYTLTTHIHGQGTGADGKKIVVSGTAAGGLSFAGQTTTQVIR